MVHGLIERTGAIQQHAHQSPFFPIQVFDTTFGFGELGVLAGLASGLRKEQWAAKALGAVAIGVLEPEGGSHAQARPAVGGAIGVTTDFFVPVGVQRNGSDAVPMRHCLIDIPVVVGSISRHMRREAVGRHDGALVEGPIVAHIGLVEGQGVLGQHHLAIHRVGASGDARAIALRG